MNQHRAAFMRCQDQIINEDIHEICRDATEALIQDNAAVLPCCGTHEVAMCQMVGAYLNYVGPARFIHAEEVSQHYYIVPDPYHIKGYLEGRIEIDYISWQY